MKIFYNGICFLKINVKGWRYPKIFCFKNQLYLTGFVFIDKGNIKQYAPNIIKLNENFEMIGKSRRLNFKGIEFLNKDDTSCWVRDINVLDDKIEMSLEIKININNEKYIHNNYVVSSKDLINFSIKKKYKYDNSFIFKEITRNDDNYIISSNIDLVGVYFWGHYLCEIKLMV